MRYGSQDKQTGIKGVWLHASEPWELIYPGGDYDGWVFLELLVRCYLTPKNNGRHGHYVLMSDQSDDSHGAVCPDCQVIAMYTLKESAPQIFAATV